MLFTNYLKYRIRFLCFIFLFLLKDLLYGRCSSPGIIETDVTATSSNCQKDLSKLIKVVGNYFESGNWNNVSRLFLNLFLKIILFFASSIVTENNLHTNYLLGNLFFVFRLIQMSFPPKAQEN